MNKEELTIKVNELAQQYGITLDNIQDALAFGQSASERIAGYLLTDLTIEPLGFDYVDIKRNMSYINELISSDNESRILVSDKHKSTGNKKIPIDSDLKMKVVEHFYNSIPQFFFIYFLHKEALEYMRNSGKPLYENEKYWKQTMKRIEKKDEPNRSDFKQTQKDATNYIWGFITKDASGNPVISNMTGRIKSGKTVAASFVVDILIECGLMGNEKLNPSQKWQRIKPYIK